MEDLELEPKWMGVWRDYIKELQRRNVRLKDRVDDLHWVISPSGLYAPKYGYIYQMGRRLGNARHWWSMSMWKLNCPLKSRLFFWCIFRNKVPTLENLKKRNKHGPGWCALRKSFE